VQEVCTNSCAVTVSEQRWACDRSGKDGSVHKGMHAMTRFRFHKSVIYDELEDIDLPLLDKEGGIPCHAANTCSK
jgi:hypothetical protein